MEERVQSFGWPRDGPGRLLTRRGPPAWTALRRLSHRPQSSSFWGLAYRILNMNPKRNYFGASGLLQSTWWGFSPGRAKSVWIGQSRDGWWQVQPEGRGKCLMYHDGEKDSRSCPSLVTWLGLENFFSGNLCFAFEFPGLASCCCDLVTCHLTFLCQ